MNYCIDAYNFNPGMFPKKCPYCEKIYQSIGEFCAETTMPSSGEDYVQDSRGAMLFRNCHCGSTLLVWERSNSYRKVQGFLRKGNSLTG